MTFGDWKASEERDHVDAFLAITEILHSVQQHFLVDCNKPVHEAFMDATRGVVERTKVLSVPYCIPREFEFGVLVPNLGRGRLAICLEHTRVRDFSVSKALVGAHTQPDEF